MSNETKPKRCSKIEHRNIQPGWGCCNCRTYNGEQREACKVCQHKRCDQNLNNQVS
jgi:hypothetical protein